VTVLSSAGVEATSALFNRELVQVQSPQLVQLQPQTLTSTSAVEAEFALVNGQLVPIASQAATVAVQQSADLAFALATGQLIPTQVPTTAAIAPDSVASVGSVVQIGTDVTMQVERQAVVAPSTGLATTMSAGSCDPGSALFVLCNRP
jgi:hypothetical protein